MDDDENLVVGQVLEKIVESSSSEILLNGHKEDDMGTPINDDKMGGASKTLIESEKDEDIVMINSENGLIEQILNHDDLVEKEPIEEGDQSKLEQEKAGELPDSVIVFSETTNNKNESDHGDDDDILPPLPVDDFEPKTSSNSESLPFLYEEEFNDDDDSSSNIEIIKHVVPSNYGHSNRFGRGDENGTGVDESDERDYVVEKILDKKIDAKGCALYLVKWEGFPSSANTWEPIQNLVECDKKMVEFEMNGAVRLAKKFKSSEQQKAGVTNNAVGKIKQAQPVVRKRTMTRNGKYREFQVMDVMGMTQYDGERYYLVSIANSTQKTFIRASLANKVFPSKIIDFYVKNLRWKQKADAENVPC